MIWSAQEKIQKLNSVAIDELKNKSLEKNFVYIFTTKTCPHCGEFKKNTLDIMLKKMKGIYSHQLCDVHDSNVYFSILDSVNVKYVPVILLFKKGNVSIYSPEQFMEHLMNL